MGQDSALEPDPFLEWERVEWIVLDCASEVGGAAGTSLSRIIPHHLQEELQLKARLTLLLVVMRELYALKNSLVGIPTRAAHKVWDMGLYSQPASVAVLIGMCLPEHQAWMESWLRMLGQQSAETLDVWQAPAKEGACLSSGKREAELHQLFVHGEEASEAPASTHLPHCDSVTLTPALH